MIHIVKIQVYLYINPGMQAKSDTQKGYPDFIRLNPII